MMDIVNLLFIFSDGSPNVGLRYYGAPSAGIGRRLYRHVKIFNKINLESYFIILYPLSQSR